MCTVWCAVHRSFRWRRAFLPYPGAKQVDLNTACTEQRSWKTWCEARYIVEQVEAIPWYTLLPRYCLTQPSIRNYCLFAVPHLRQGTHMALFSGPGFAL